MPKYRLTGRNQSGKTKTVTVFAETADDATEAAHSENAGYKFGLPEVIREQVKIKGPFIWRTFESAAKNAGHDEGSAKTLFADYLKAGTVVSNGSIGLANQNSFIFTK